MAFWIIIDPDGAHRHQVRTRGSEEPWRDTPDGWSYFQVPRHSHDPRERFDEKSRRWKACPVLTAEHEAREQAAATARAAAMPDAVLDALADRIATKLDERRKQP